MFSSQQPLSVPPGKRPPIVNALGFLPLSVCAVLIAIAAVLALSTERANASGSYTVPYPGPSYEASFNCDQESGICDYAYFHEDGQAGFTSYIQPPYAPQVYVNSYADAGPYLGAGVYTTGGFYAVTSDSVYNTDAYGNKSAYQFGSGGGSAICGPGNEGPDDVYTCTASATYYSNTGYDWVIDSFFGWGCDASNCTILSSTGSTDEWSST